MTSDDIQNRLGENVKRIRKSLKLTQFELAEKAELSEETVKNIELSRCWTSDKNLAKLTKALDVDIHTLFLLKFYLFPCQYSLMLIYFYFVIGNGAMNL